MVPAATVVRLNVPLVGTEELQRIEGVLESGFLTQGKETQRFEELVRAQVATSHAFATSSATTGLHLALHAMGIGPGDEVIMPAFSFPATANAVIQLGAIPVFVDIDVATFNIDPIQLESAVSARTSAVMPVHAFGLTADMDPINAFAHRHSLPVLEDAACALAARYHGREAGSLGTAGVFSFHPRKIITTGEGGMVTTNDPKLAERIQVLRSHGGVRGALYMDFVDAGYNYRLSDVHAAIGVAQMGRLRHITAERARLAAELTVRLRESPLLETPRTPPGLVHAYQSYVVLLDEAVDRDAVIRSMKRRGIETTLGTYGMHLQPYFRNRFFHRPETFPGATLAHRQALTLPMYPGMSDDDLDQLVEELAASTERARSSPANLS